MFAIYMTDNSGNRFQIDADDGASSVLGCGRPRIFQTRSDAEAVASRARSGSWESVTIEPVKVVEAALVESLDAENRQLRKVLGELYAAVGDAWPPATREEVERALEDRESPPSAG
jgi:xanthine/CO dehydrogenase XdhC/CoxF family maturation factor